MNRAQLVRRIRAEWPTIVEASGCIADALDCLPSGDLALFGSSYKTEKGAKFGVKTGVVYMSAAKSSGRQACGFSTPECRDLCLGHTTGHLRFDSSQRAQLWKTALYFGARPYFRALADFDIRKLARAAKSTGMIPAARFDGCTDLGFGQSAAKRHPDVAFYDYTKSPNRALKNAKDRPKNYRLTFSYSGRNLDESLAVLGAGGNVAVVFDTVKGQPLPDSWNGWPVLDGDSHDYRASDPRGYVVGLRFKTALKRPEQIERAGCFVERTAKLLAISA